MFPLKVLLSYSFCLVHLYTLFAMFLDVLVLYIIPGSQGKTVYSVINYWVEDLYFCEHCEGRKLCTVLLYSLFLLSQIVTRVVSGLSHLLTHLCFYKLKYFIYNIYIYITNVKLPCLHCVLLSNKFYLQLKINFACCWKICNSF